MFPDKRLLRLTFYHAAAIQVSCSQPIQSSWKWCGHSWVFGTWTRHCSAQKPGKRAQLELGTALEVYVVAWNVVHIASMWYVEEDRATRSIRTGKKWWENQRQDIVMSAVPMWLHYCFWVNEFCITEHNDTHLQQPPKTKPRVTVQS